ncbi:MAG: hypothetical protein ACREL3_01365, partial [Gemmatimonadales bacterium]
MRTLWLLPALALLACSTETTPLELAANPATVGAVSDLNPRGAVGTTLASPIAIRVVDANGLPTPAIPVVWTAARGSVIVIDDSTDANGTARATWTLPATPGTDQVVAGVNSVGSVTFTATVAPVPETIVFRYLDAGSYHACGITTTERLICWGYGADGQLGSGTSTQEPFPTLIGGDLRYRLISGGRYHTCGLTLAGLGLCWGNNGDGRLGNGNAPTSSAVPVNVVTGSGVFLTFQAIAAGRVHTCALDLSQHAWCWGYNGEGEVGPVAPAGPGSAVDTATIVPTLPLKTVVTGGLHSCAVTTAGGGLCWGYNAFGQLGDGTATTSAVPQSVTGGLTFNTDPRVVFPSPDPDFPLPPGPYIAAGYDHTCAITAAGQTVCWGLNEDGQLGDNTATQRAVPTTVAGGQSFVAITAGLNHTCALTSAGSAFCWGDNTFGQLGDGTTSGRFVPTAVAGGLSFAYIKAGDLSTCGVTSAGVAYCWGDNEYGQLGDGTVQGSSSPV